MAATSDEGTQRLLFQPVLTGNKNNRFAVYVQEQCAGEIRGTEQAQESRACEADRAAPYCLSLGSRRSRKHVHYTDAHIGSIQLHTWIGGVGVCAGSERGLCRNEAL